MIFLNNNRSVEKEAYWAQTLPIQVKTDFLTHMRSFADYYFPMFDNPSLKKQLITYRSIKTNDYTVKDSKFYPGFYISRGAPGMSGACMQKFI